MEKDIKKIIEESINAPSGSNSQPWEFKIKVDTLEIFALPEKDHPVLNYSNRGTWVAHGALIENISIASQAMGYNTEIVIFPNWPEKNITAKIKFIKTDSIKDVLFRAIKNRCTNRKPYNKKSLSDEQKKELENVLDEKQKKQTVFIEDKKKITELCNLLSVNEIVTLENKKLHELFFKEIVWDKKDALSGVQGLFLPTMELIKPKQLALRVVKKWDFINKLNKFGFAKAIAKGNAKIYSATPIMGAILTLDDDKSFIEAGRTMERIWLKATDMGLSFHMISGAMFFWQSLKNEAIKSLLDESNHVILLEKTYSGIKSIFNNPPSIVALTFRIGYAKNPSALSYKKQPHFLE